jgi:hypothetical protein
MYRRLVLAFLLVFSLAAGAQETGNSESEPAGPPPLEQGPGGHGEWGRGRHFQGVAGTITAVSGDSLQLKARDGNTVQVNLSDKTQYRRNREAAKLEDFKAGDEVFVRGQQSSDGVWQAELVALRPAGGPGGPQAFREGLGKQFIVGDIKEINGTQLTILRPDGVTQTIAVDENTSFRKDHESITLADLKAGDHVFGRGEVKNDIFVAAVLNSGQPRFMGRRGLDGGTGGPGGPPQP